MSHCVILRVTGAPEVLVGEAREVPKPPEGQVLVHNHAAGVNHIDTLVRRGLLPPGVMPDLPHVPGVEGAGIVEAVGEGVTAVSVGDRVAWMGPIGSGGYGSHSVVPAIGVAALQPDADLVPAAALPVNAMTAWHMLVNLGRTGIGDAVLVHAAAGGVGTMAVQLAKHLGAKVIATASSGKHAHVLSQGADHVLDHMAEDVTSAVLDLTGGRGVNLSLNPIAGETIAGDLAALAPLGTVMLYGFLGGLPANGLAADLAARVGGSPGIRMSDIYTYMLDRPEAFHADLKTVLGLYEAGIVTPHLHAVLPLDDAALTHRLLEDRLVQGKLVLATG